MKKIRIFQWPEDDLYSSLAEVFGGPCLPIFYFREGGEPDSPPEILTKKEREEITGFLNSSVAIDKKGLALAYVEALLRLREIEIEVASYWGRVTWENSLFLFPPRALAGFGLTKATATALEKAGIETVEEALGKMKKKEKIHGIGVERSRNFTFAVTQIFTWQGIPPRP